MKFNDTYIFKEDKFSVGVEESTGKYYLSIPVANSYVEYEEYYEIDAETYSSCPLNVDDLRVIAAKSRARENDLRLIVQPGRLRGFPV